MMCHWQRFKKYISQEVTIVELQKMSNADATMQSFKLTISSDEEGKVKDSDFWPEGVCCRRFIHKRIMPKPNGFNRDTNDNS